MGCEFVTSVIMLPVRSGGRDVTDDLQRGGAGVQQQNVLRSDQFCSHFANALLGVDVKFLLLGKGIGTRASWNWNGSPVDALQAMADFQQRQVATNRRLSHPELTNQIGNKHPALLQNHLRDL